MKDLVERQAVLDLIHENWYASNEFYLKQIEGLPTIDSEPQWIPVSERLPKVAGLYMVTDSKGDVVRFIFENTETSREFWRRCAKAWMPLPKPYEGDKA